MDKPIATVGVLLIEGNKVLLVRHNESAEHPTDTYGLPAGRMEENESEKEAALRELKEEAGLTASVEDLIELPTTYTGIMQRKTGDKLYSYKVFLGKSFSGSLSEGDEASACWVNISDLDKYDLLPNNVDKIIKEGVEIEDRDKIRDSKILR